MLAEVHQTAIISSFLSGTIALKYHRPNGDKTVKQPKNIEQSVKNTENKICIVNPNQKQALACGHQDTHRNNSCMNQSKLTDTAMEWTRLFTNVHVNCSNLFS